TTVIVFFPLMMAIDMLTEAALSFLSIGVQEPNASWGTIIQDGQQLLYTRPWVALAPGIAIALTVLALNVLGDGVRDALDRGAKVVPQRLEAAPVTLSLVIGAARIWVVVSIAMGVLAAVFRGTALDVLVMVLGLIGISMPVFWVGEVVNLLSQSRLHHTFLF